MRIALAGNPNSGKTTMYNALTGRNEKVGNWAGVTVERKEHEIKKSLTGGKSGIVAVDLPGAYSMSPFTSEESITSSYVRNENPDAIINIVDATNLSRSLFFTTQLLELGIPVVVALNKADINKKKGTKIDTQKLSQLLKCPVIDTVSTSSEGLESVVLRAIESNGNSQEAPWTQGDIDLSNKEEVVAADKRRFDFVNGIVKSTENRKILTREKNSQDKLDRVLTNKWLGIPIFAVVMFLVFQISQVWVGPWIAEGYVFEKDDTVSLTYGENVYDMTRPDESEEEGILGKWELDGTVMDFSEDGTFTLTQNGSVKSGEYTFEEDVLTAELDGEELDVEFDSNDVEIPGLVTLIEMFQEKADEWLEDASPILRALLVDGIIGGVGAVVGFLPLVMVMYFLIALLEDCGYMARVSVVLDPIFKKVGLSGKSVIPFVIGVGCAIPGVMASRTIRNERERRATAMLTSFMPCGAKIPVISLFAGAFFDNAGWVSTLMYFSGIILIFFGALIINKIAGYKSRKSFFIMELPEYKAPSFLRAFKSMCSRGWAYIVKAATIILLCNTAVQVMESFTWSFKEAESADVSILASIAHPFAYLIVPVVGILSWQLAAAAVTGFIAKENVVGTLAVCFGITSFIDVEELAMIEGSGAEVYAAFGLTKVAALAYLMFNLFTPPCFAAIGAMNSEMKSKKWLWGAIGFQLGTGFTVGYLVYQIGTLITTGKFGAGFAGGLVAVAVFAGVLIYLCATSDKRLKAEYALDGKKATPVSK